MADKKVHIFHHYDADGYGGAAVIGGYLRAKYRNHGGVDLEFHSCNHKFPIDFSTVADTDDVYIVDYSFSRVDDCELISKWVESHRGNRFVWIDHHETSNVIVAKYPFFKRYLDKGKGYLCISKDDEPKFSGCLLAHLWLMHNDPKLGGSRIINNQAFHDHDLEYLVDLEENATPNWIYYISDYDTFTHNSEASIPFNKGVGYYTLANIFLGTGENSFMSKYEDLWATTLIPDVPAPFADFGDVFQHYAVDDYDANEICRKCIEIGTVLTEEQNRIYKSRARDIFECVLCADFSRDYIDASHELKIDDRFLENDGSRICYKAKVAVLNDRGNSLNFMEKFQEYDAVIIFSFDGTQWTHSIFSNNNGIPVNTAAMYFGKCFGTNGGGHQHAAGFSSLEPLFAKNRIVELRDSSCRIIQCADDSENTIIKEYI